MKLPFLVNTPPSRKRRRPQPAQKKRSGLGRRSRPVSPLQQLLWGLIGLGLTIGGTFLEAYIITPTSPELTALNTFSLGISWQVGAVLLTGCLGGPWAAAGSQLAYMLLGLLNIQNIQIFTLGGGLDYLQEPAFGYILGFIPGAWLCGLLAFRWPPRLETLALSSGAGLVVIHVVGIGYQVGLQVVNLSRQSGVTLLQGVTQYSLGMLPGQVAMVCGVSVLAIVLRRIMFY